MPKRVERLRMASHSEGLFDGVVVVGRAAARARVRAAGEQAGDETLADDGKAPRKFEDGLPVRSDKAGAISTRRLDVHFRDHGKAQAPALAAAARDMLK